MTSTMAYDFGNIILVPFPFTNQQTSKQRPAVIISHQIYNSSKPDVIIMAVTSQMRAVPTLGEHWIRQWQAAGLLKPSAVKPIIATLEQRLILKTLGTLAMQDQEALRQIIGQIVG
jgi:mRNA interferase MazF